MFGKFISSAIKVATLPLDAANAAMDMATGGDGSKRSRTHPGDCTPTGELEKLRDRVAEAAEEIDN